MYKYFLLILTSTIPSFVLCANGKTIPPKLPDRRQQRRNPPVSPGTVADLQSRFTKNMDLAEDELLPTSGTIPTRLPHTRNGRICDNAATRLFKGKCSRSVDQTFEAPNEEPDRVNKRKRGS